MSEEINRLDRLIAFMRMTEGAEKNEQEARLALVAIKKANAMLKAEGWDWEKLLRGKVRVIADPFATGPQVSAPPPTQARPMDLRPARPQPPPQPQPSANPWPQGQQPKPKPRPQPPPYAPKPTAPPGPVMFRRGSDNAWYIANYKKFDASGLGGLVTISKKDGTSVTETLGAFKEQDAQGYYLYEIQKASKWKRKFADQQGMDDFL